MKEIKFRAWDTINKILTYGTKEEWFKNYIHIHIELDGTLFIQRQDQTVDNENEFILMQYTGLKEKNGKEIYEGDIVKIKFNLDEVDNSIYMNLTDKEKLQETVIKEIYEIPDCYQQPELSAEDITIIGNIYKNSELLEKEEN